MTPEYSAGHAPVPGALPVLFLSRHSVLECQTRGVHARPQSIVVIVTRHTSASAISDETSGALLQVGTRTAKHRPRPACCSKS